MLVPLPARMRKTRNETDGSASTRTRLCTMIIHQHWINNMEKKVSERSVSAFNNELKLKGFNVFQIEEDSNVVRNYSRKDFYKICLTTGESLINYADRSYLMKDTILFLQIRKFRIPGKRSQEVMWVIPVCSRRTFISPQTVRRAFNIHPYLRLEAHRSFTLQRKSVNSWMAFSETWLPSKVLIMLSKMIS